MTDIHTIANLISAIGTTCGLSSRIPQVYKTYTSRSAKDLSEHTMMLNITANSCFLFYTIVNEQYPIMVNCLSVILLEGSLLYMKKTFKDMKKSSSGTSLVDLDNLDN